MLPYIDIHHHKKYEDSTGIVSVRNLHNNWSLVGDEPDSYFSVGVHPWYIDDEFVRAKAIETELLHYASHPNVLAIGECGMDRLNGPDPGLQLELFESHIRCANDLKKPLIIHCVRARNEILSALSSALNVQPVIFHGYNQKQPEELIRKGYFLSFGAAILQEESNACRALRSIPADRFFLESDDGVHDIRDIYERAAIIRNTDPNEIKRQANDNFKSIIKLT